ncbi:MAG: stage II sporulation protein E, partial [Actinobacteria bacterium]
MLVVDDRAAAPLADWLAEAGYDVVRAATGAEALHQLDQTPVDLVVLDVQRSDRDGADVCAQIKADPRHAALPVIHVSTHRPGELDRGHELSHGDVYLAEPIEPEELVATAQAVLRYARARRRAELLANRLAQLAEATLAVHSAATFEQMLRVAAEGGAGIFEAPVVVVAESA